MQITTTQLNQVAVLLGTTDKNVVFGAVLATLVDAGIAARDAFDTLFGAGSYVAFAGDLHMALRGQ